jgi:hypothetical protein
MHSRNNLAYSRHSLLSLEQAAGSKNPTALRFLRQRVPCGCSTHCGTGCPCRAPQRLPIFIKQHTCQRLSEWWSVLHPRTEKLHRRKIRNFNSKHSYPPVLTLCRAAASLPAETWCTGVPPAPCLVWGGTPLRPKFCLFSTGR